MAGCACGGHHAAPARIAAGAEILLARPLVALTGTLTCRDMDQMLLALDLLPEHVAQSRAEPGNLRFDLHQQEDPLLWQLDELFADAEAFTRHQNRTAASRWGKDSHEMRRDYRRTEALPRLRLEHPQDHAAIHALLTRAFGGEDEAALVRRLRLDGDLALSLVADAAGCIVGHVALSGIQAAGPALALAPVAVHPAVRRRGIGAALVRAALDAFPGHSIIVLGDPAYYTRFGFTPVDLASPHAGPHLMACGPALPQGSTIRHARAFAAP
ncbi:MAG: GNAT family N-acetyltransferase [Paracoccus sp. (in: a-proteobacteria)]|uniref:GNAT family N-acetyltransferase n=1 Tax=Paracoccus sp. TaxID=267 RepID=UPI0039E5CEE1